MRKKLIAMGLAVCMMMPVAAWAQGPGGGGPGGAGGFQRTMKGRLGGLMRGIGELEKGKAPLTRDQAKKVVGFVAPWKSRPKMTEEDGKALFMHVNAVLTTKQKNELDKIQALRRRSAGQGGGPGAGAGGGGGGGGGFGGGAPDPKMRAQFQKMAGFRKTMNPFYPPSNYKEMKDAPERMRDGMTKRYQGTMALLTALSKKANGH